MPELLIELFSEEIPARMQARAASDLRNRLAEALRAEGLHLGETDVYATPRRLTLHAADLPAGSPETTEERKGPRVGAPEKALEGFMRAAGLTSIDEAEIVSDPKKGDFYVARLSHPGRSADDILAEVLPGIIRRFPWPKSMRWGKGDLAWVRPLHNVMCLLGGEPVKVAVDGVATSPTTRGHRFMAPDEIEVSGFSDYCDKLKSARVMLEGGARRGEIVKQAERVAKKAGLQWRDDAALLDENAGLVEWPTVLMGTFDEDFLTVPPEVLVLSMKAHQKCFSLYDPGTGRLANRFLLVTNLKARDGGKRIVAGNERVIRARLSDAKFFWEKDLATPLADMAETLSEVTFHEKLGNQHERVDRIAKLARDLSPVTGANPQMAERAARLCKADLVSEMVGEFPELQGVMGRYYAAEQGEAPEVAAAIEEHYQPQGPNDRVPGAPVSMAVALADKLDMLAGFWAINEKPTGSKDPFALRRAALGIVRIVLENELRLDLFRTLARPFARIQGDIERTHIEEQFQELEELSEHGFSEEVIESFRRETLEAEIAERGDITNLMRLGRVRAIDLLSFFADRLKVYLRDQGVRHDLIDAIFSLGGQDDLTLIVSRVRALGDFLETDDGANLLTGVKRAQNILRIEEKNDGRSYSDAPDPALFAATEEKALAKAINRMSKDAGAAIEREDFATAMRALAKLRAPVDAFFDHVTVNADDPALRENRLKLLAGIRAATSAVADFTKIEGGER